MVRRRVKQRTRMKFAVLNIAARKDFMEKVSFEQSIEIGEKGSRAAM